MKKTTAYARNRDARGLPPGHFHNSIQLPVTIRFAQTHETQLQLAPHTALEKLKRGVADEEDYTLLAVRLNWARFLAESHFHGSIEPCQTAQTALKRVAQANANNAQWLALCADIAAIGEGLNIADAIQLQCTRRELRDALSAVYDINQRLTAKA